jgi:hypothetical protein
MHIRQLTYCVVLIGILAVVAKTAPPAWRDLWERFVRGLSSIERKLRKNQSGQHVIFVSYAGLASPHDEWIYNPANIDAAPVIWALDLRQPENEKLRRYYAGGILLAF